MKLKLFFVKRLYRSGDSRWGVFLARGPDGEDVKVVGELHWDERPIYEEVEGEWMSHKEHGKQFKLAGVTALGNTPLNETIKKLKAKNLTDFEVRVVIERFKGDAYSILEANPYCAMWCDGIGFKRADGIARRFGVSGKDPRRAIGALIWELQEASRDGHCFLPLGKVMSSIQKITGIDRDMVLKRINECSNDLEKWRPKLAKSPELEAAFEWYSLDGDRVWLDSCRTKETLIAEWLKGYRCLQETSNTTTGS